MGWGVDALNRRSSENEPGEVLRARIGSVVITIETIALVALGLPALVQYRASATAPKSTAQAISMLRSTDQYGEGGSAYLYLVDHLPSDEQAPEAIAAAAATTTDKDQRTRLFDVLSQSADGHAVLALRELLRHESTSFRAAVILADAGNDAGRSVLEAAAADPLGPNSEEASRALATLSSMPTAPSEPPR